MSERHWIDPAQLAAYADYEKFRVEAAAHRLARRAFAGGDRRRSVWISPELLFLRTEHPLRVDLEYAVPTPR